ncbi:uncharacterized protein LOC132548423 [Ylistrum balloti]|uniref:uncharacterized protein LOC132548423 n=1 Tax=Ylistrum balloti TaxID=509963 RepID=UPI002905DAD5|nr:uncharacterized protein LOC132548423 [Ylistrum balloti]
MSGMFSAYVISVLLKKRFLVTYSRPSNFTDYIIPNSFDWRYNSSILSGRTSLFLNFFCRVPVPIRNKDTKSLGNIFKADVTFVRMNWDYTLHFRRFKSLHKAIPWIFNLQFADIYVKFFNTLFKPVDDIVETINKTLRSVTKLACAHIRMGGNETQDHQRTDRKQLIHIWNFLKTKEDNYSIFIATDSELVRNTAKSLFKQILEVKGRILHIDQNPAGSGVTNGYKKVATDFFLLSKCDVLMLTRSGFGMMSAYLNTNNPSLYCLVKDEVVPCSRYTLHNYYPGEILSPY